MINKGLDVQFHLATAEQKEQLANSKLALTNYQLYVAELLGENARLRERLKNDQEIVYDEAGAVKLRDELWCAGCYGAKNNLVHLKKAGCSNNYDCPVCKAHYTYR